MTDDFIFDGEELLYALLARACDGWATVAPSLDVGAVDSYPLVIFGVSGGNALDDSLYEPAAWEFSLNLTVLDEADNVRATVGKLYRAVRGWNDPWPDPDTGVIAGLVDDLGHATAVTDRAIFTRTQQAAIADKTVSQYDGGFDLQLHAA